MLRRSLQPPRLEDIAFLKDVGASALRDARKEVDWFSLPGGWTLFREGEPADALYFLRAGALGIFVDQPGEDQPVLTAIVRAGEPVGEMAMIANTAHSATVTALRDSELLSLPRAGFMQLIRKHPELMQALARLVVLRMRAANRGKSVGPRVFAAVNCASIEAGEDFIQGVAGSIRASGRTVSIFETQDQMAEHGGLDEAEKKANYIFLSAQRADESWVRSCIRQADRLLLLADPRMSPSGQVLPSLRTGFAKRTLSDLVFIHEGRRQPAAAPASWIAGAQATRVFNVIRGRAADHERVARACSLRGIGLVLSGGGARAYAHVGVVKALREKGVPIDFTGGVSMGAIVGAGVAAGWGDRELDARMRDAFVKSNPLKDLRLPVVALTGGDEVDARLERHFGDLRIEDLERPFFCLAADLTVAEPIVFRSGPLRQALRASLAIPGLIPPVVDDRGHVLVDGAVVNNFPASLMQSFFPGLVIGADVTRYNGLDAADFQRKPSAMEWIWENGVRTPPPIAGLLIRAGTMMTEAERRQQSQFVDIMISPALPQQQLRDWSSYDAAVEEGYQATMRALAEAVDILPGSKAALLGRRAGA